MEKYTGKNVKIAILDSGIDSSHEALSVKKEISLVDTEDLSYSTGHGTHVAGIISRIAPNSDLYSVKLLNKRNVGNKSSIVSALDWCIDNNIDIVNMGFSFNKKSNIINQVLQTAYKQGLLLVAAAGNEGAFLKESITFPGAYNSVIAVGSVDQNNERSMFSSVGNSLELMAPGENIYSTEPKNKYGLRSGTSMAAPFVTGVASLIMKKNKKLSNKEIKKILNNTAQKIGEPFLYGNGLINPEEALLQSGGNPD